jgi:mono/diheme cytochrome c family protein
MELSRPMTGSTLGRFEAPDITPEGLAGRGWIQAELREFLGSGLVEEGSAFSDMHPVVMLSTRRLTANDLSKAATYLIGDRPPPPARLPDAPSPAVSAATASGRVTYVALCAGCHGLNGEGVPNTVVPMRGNTTLRLANPRNLIVSMVDGIAAQSFPYLQRMQAMPPFADRLSDQQAAELANYPRQLRRAGARCDASRRARVAVTPAAVMAKEALRPRSRDRTGPIGVLVRRVRGKIEKDPGSPKILTTESEFGYRLEVSA